MLSIFSLAFILAQVAAPATQETTIGDRLYVWSHPAGSYNNDPYLKGQKPSKIEPVDGVTYLGLKNTDFIRYRGVPALPFDDYYSPFRSLDRVVWSLTGADGLTSAEERKEVFKLAANNKNITGFILDDFFKDISKEKNLDDENTPLPASLTPKDLADLRSSLTVNGRALPLNVVVYTHQIVPRAKPHLKHVDNITMWTWNPAQLDQLEQNLKKLEALAPDKGILLGCYLYDFNGNAPLPVARMKQQTEMGYRWLREGRIKGMLFLGTPMVDLGLEAVEWTREWVAKVKDEPCKVR